MSDKGGKDFNIYGYSLEIGFRISVPLLLFILLGVWMDKEFHTGHLFLFLGIGLSLFTSAYGIKKTIDNLKGNN